MGMDSPVAAGPPGSAATVVPVSRRAVWWAARAASLATLAALLAACGGGAAGQAPAHHPPSPGRAEATRPGSGTSPPPRWMGLMPASPALADRLILTGTDVASGVAIKGTLLVINHGRKAINLNRGCRPKYEVVLTAPHYLPAIAFPADCSGQPFIIKPGPNRIGVTVLTTYLACSGSKHLMHGEHACLRGNRMPPLPAGRYRAVLVGDGLPLPAPASVAVTLR